MATPVERLVRGYLDHLTVERGASVHTVAAYRRDLARYTAFLAETGRRDEAEEALAEVERRARKANTHFRKEANVWRDFAAAAVKAG